MALEWGVPSPASSSSTSLPAESRSNLDSVTLKVRISAGKREPTGAVKFRFRQTTSVFHCPRSATSVNVTTKINGKSNFSLQRWWFPELVYSLYIKFPVWQQKTSLHEKNERENWPQATSSDGKGFFGERTWQETQNEGGKLSRLGSDFL